MSSLSARETAYQTIRSRIITMELKPGDPLNDRELAEELGISRTPMREALLMLNIARMVDIKPQSGTHVAPINLKLMEMEQFSRYALEKEVLNRLRGRLTEQQIADYRRCIDDYRALEADLGQPRRTARMLELDNAFHRRAFEICGMEDHYNYMLSKLQHVERIRKFKPADRGEQIGVRGPHPHSGSTDQRQPGGCGRGAAEPPDPLQALGGAGPQRAPGIFHRRIKRKGGRGKAGSPFFV